MKLKLSSTSVLILIVLYIGLIGTMSVITHHYIWIDNGGYYILDEVKDIGKFNSDNDNMVNTNNVNDAEFVAVDTGYSFDKIEDFEYYGTYESPIIMAVEHYIKVETLDYKEFANAVMNKDSYESLGIRSTSLSGKVKYSLSGSDNDKSVIEDFLSRLYGEEYWNILKAKKTNTHIDSGAGIYIQFAYRGGYDTISTNLPHVALIVDIYRRADSTKELDTPIGFTKVDEADLENIINVKSMPDNFGETIGVEGESQTEQEEQQAEQEEQQVDENEVQAKREMIIKRLLALSVVLLMTVIVCIKLSYDSY